jgi:hypothetical protein
MRMHQKTGSRMSEARQLLQLFMTEGAGGGHLRGKTAELLIYSSKATGSNTSIVMPDPESHDPASTPDMSDRR